MRQITKIIKSDRPRDGRLNGYGRLDQYSLLIGLGFIFYLIHEQAQFQPREGELSAEIPLFPIPYVVWFTGGWLLFSTLLWWVFKTPFQSISPARSLALRRGAMACVFLAYLVELYARVSIAGFFGMEERLTMPVVLAGAAVGLSVFMLLMLRPPSTKGLIRLFLGSGLALRAAWYFLVTPTPQHSDNLFVIQHGLERMMAGVTPYGYFDFGTHTNPMPYLPWTFLSYVPPYVLGLDLRITSMFFSIAMLVAFGLIITALRLPKPARDSLLMILAMYYTLPINVSLDEHTEFGLFNLMLIMTFAFVAMGRWRSSAIAYGFALGAMPVALFCAAPLLCYLIRKKPWPEVAAIASIVTAISAIPVLVFMLWDANAFLWAVSYVPRESWAALDTGQWVYHSFTPIVWHYLGGWLRIVQLTWFLVFASLAAKRVNSPLGLIGLASGSYLMLVLSGPYVGPHLIQVVPLLAVLAVAVSAPRVENEAQPDVSKVDAWP